MARCCRPPTSSCACRPTTPPGAKALAGSGNKKWSKSQLKVYFFGHGCLVGVDNRPALVLAAASQWSMYTGVSFVQTTDCNESDIRITFGGEFAVPSDAYAQQPGEIGDVWVKIRKAAIASTWKKAQDKGFCPEILDAGAWSHVGTDARQVPKSKPTMNLGFLVFMEMQGPTKLRDVELFNGTVLHEFGHALGFEHENPGVVPYSKTKILERWKEEQASRGIMVDAAAAAAKEQFIETNYFQEADTKLSDWDARSIMSYPVTEDELDTTSSSDHRKFVHGRNSVLSDTDKAMAREFYKS